MVIFVCEDCVDGIFTGVYDAWESRLGHANVALRVAGPADLELFAEYREVRTDGEKARKVADTIRRRMGAESYEMIYRAALAGTPEKADCIYRVLAVGLSRHTDAWTSHHILEKLQDANACKVFELSRKVWHEAHRYEGFVRFRELEGGVLFSEIEAENQVLPLIGAHFSDRFPNEYFLIYDHHFGDCLVHAAQRQWFIWRGAGAVLDVDQKLEHREKEEAGSRAGNENLAGSRTGNGNLAGSMIRSGNQAGSRTGDRNQAGYCLGEAAKNQGDPIEKVQVSCSLGEQEIRRLWCGFCDSIAIRERENLCLQMQFWPLKFRKWMTEGSPSGR